MSINSKSKNISKNLAIAGFLFVLVYFPTLLWMWDRWFAIDSYYSHGILIPFFSGYLIWQDRAELKKIRPESSSAGLGLLILGISLHLLSLWMRVYFTSGLSMIPVLMGFVLYVYGKKMFKAIFFPLFFLVFMIPFPLVAIINISFQLKILSAKIAAALLNTFNIPALLDGSYIKMLRTTVIVGDVCSGLRSLISLLAVGSLFAYWMKSGLLKKGILFLSAIPIAVITNTIRVLILALVSEFLGPEYLNGFFHTLSGLFVFGLAIILIAGLAKLLEEI